MPKTDTPVFDGERIDKVDERITLIQKRAGFSYGTDAVLLAAFIRKNGGKTAVELGAGTGIVSLLCAEFGKFEKIYSVEIQNDYFDLLRRNIQLNEFEIEPLKFDLRELKASDVGGEVDAVFANPPYMRSDSGKANSDPGKNFSRHEINGGIADFCGAAGRLLKFGGLFYCVYRPDREVDLLCSMRSAGLEPKRLIHVYPSQSGRPCLVLAEAKKGASPSVLVTRPFFIYNGNGEIDGQTDEMKKAYSECDMYDEYKRF